jgi:hypothetical protein
MITLIYFIIKTCNLQNSSIYLNYYGRPSKEFNEIHLKSCSIWQFLLPLISNSVPPSIHIKALIVFYFFFKKNFHTLLFFRGFPCLLTDVYTQLISTFNWKANVVVTHHHPLRTSVFFKKKKKRLFYFFAVNAITWALLTNVQGVLHIQPMSPQLIYCVEVGQTSIHVLRLQNVKIDLYQLVLKLKSYKSPCW